MAQVLVTAQLSGGEGKPLAGHRLSLQVFRLSGGWTEVAEGVTDEKGRVGMKLVEDLDTKAAAPAMRLVEAGSPGPRVLGAPVMMLAKGTGARASLLVDFGEIERLDAAAYPRQASEDGLPRGAGTVAGLPRKRGLSQTNVLISLERNPMLRNAMSGNVVPPGGITLNADLAHGSLVVSEATEVGGGAVALARELGEARAILLQKDSALAAKDLEIKSKAVELETKTAELETVRHHAGQLEANLSDALSRAEVAESEAAGLKAKIGEPAEITTVLSGLGAKLVDTNQALQGGAVPFRLGAIKVDLRGRITKDGSGIVMGGEVADGSGLSAEMHADVPRDRGDAAGVTAPDCTGLTPTAAARVLRSVGLRLRPAEQRLPEGQGTPGQAITQHPGPGASAPHGSEVLVVFGTRPGE